MSVTQRATAASIAPVSIPPSELKIIRAIVRRSLRDQRRSPLTWGIPLGLMSALELAIFPSVHKSLGKALATYPDSLKQAFHIESIRTPAEFLNGEMFSFVIPLAIAFFAIRAATRPVVGYEERRWIDTVLAAPVRRRALVAGGFAAAAISSAAVLLVMSALIFASGEVFGAVIPAGDVLSGAASVWPLGLFFAGVALLLAGRLGTWSGVTAGAAGLLVAMYVIDVTARIAGGLHAIGPVSAFHYVGSALVNGVSAADFAGLSAAALLLAAIGAALFERRDIRG